MFLKGIMAAGGATALTAVSASQLAGPQKDAVQAGEDPAAAPQGYRETAHIKAYYRTLKD